MLTNFKYFFYSYSKFILFIIIGILIVIFFGNKDFFVIFRNWNWGIFADVITALSLVIALSAYFYQKKKDKNFAAIEQVSFFRKEIIPKCDEFINLVKDEKKGKFYEFKKIKLDEPTLEYVRENYNEELLEQEKIYKQSNTWAIQTTLLNMMTELALKIKHFDTVDHEALNSIKASFVEIVEINSLVLLMQKYIITGNSTYSEIINLYLCWKDDIDRRTPQERSLEFVRKIADKTMIK